MSGTTQGTCVIVQDEDVERMPRRGIAVRRLSDAVHAYLHQGASRQSPLARGPLVATELQVVQRK